jgi:methylase of polypeptide subunit release factors
MRTADRVKTSGAHYTPPELAHYLASLALEAAKPSTRLRVLDPACGDGSLLLAVAEQARKLGQEEPELVGLDSDPSAADLARKQLEEFTGRAPRVSPADFFDVHVAHQPQASLFEAGEIADDLRPESFNIVIANPPYVRTQVLGAQQSQLLSARLGLSGRVDLYHAFVRAIRSYLAPNGTLALLCSNRFLFTRAGASVRETLSQDFIISQIIDLGDTKLFGAAVLPAIVIATRTNGRRPAATSFTRIYSVRNGARTPIASAVSVIAALQMNIVGTIQVGRDLYEIERGVLESDSSHQPWRLTTTRSQDWLNRVIKNASASFADVSRIRVGIKTTADSVFIRDDWSPLPKSIRPESVLIHPLLTHEVADRWLQAPTSAAKQVLYPHRVEEMKREAVPLDRYPRTAAYLEQNRSRLESRTYVIQAGRKWYEIWVPQDPEAWRQPKVVFPDISEVPKFFLDESGAIVNGDCYWITLRPGVASYWLRLVLAVANSSLGVRYYDEVCGNRLYAGRRRFITQYLERFPLPNPKNPAVAEILDLVAELLLPDSREPHRRVALEARLDRAVWRSFGFVEEIAG